MTLLKNFARANRLTKVQAEAAHEQALLAFADVWRQTFGESLVTARQLADHAGVTPGLMSALLPLVQPHWGETQAISTKRLGSMLGQHPGLFLRCPGQRWKLRTEYLPHQPPAPPG